MDQMSLPQTAAPGVSVRTDDPEGSLNTAIGMADSFIRKEYLAQLQNAQAVPLIGSGECVGRNIRMFHLASLTYSETDDLHRKIASVFHSVAEFNSRQFLLLDSDGFRVSLYLGIACERQDQLSMQFNTLKGAFTGNFPGGRLALLNASKSEELLKGIFEEEGIRISSVSALSTAKEISRDSIYGIERLVDGMYGKPFTMMFLCQAVPKEELRRLRQSYEAMYTQLTPFRECAASVNQSEARGETQSFSLSKSESVTQGRTVTESGAFGQSSSRSETVSGNKEANESRAKNQLLGTALSLTAIISGIGTGAAAMHPLQGLFYGGSVSNVLNSVQTLLGGGEPGRSETAGEGKSYTLTFSEGETSSYQEGFSASKSVSGSSTDTAGYSLQMQYENKAVSDLLEVLQEQIVRCQHIEETGGFQCAAYFVTGDNSTAITAASMYRSLLGSMSSLGQSNAVNVWSDSETLRDICEYLKICRHPVFHFENRPDYPTFTAGTLVAADELPLYISFPRKSISGFPVALRAEFARDVIRMETDCEAPIEVGKIYHLGKPTPSPVALSKQDLSGHIFVAGTTGMGKSNFCYGLLDSLRNEKVRFMVIEPAKGEYKQVFGGCEGIHIFGTNPNLSPLLRINPFSFPGGIHVNEHIDRLLEIFNSCWPMYAAMPAVLKDALETAYRQCGYNLVTGAGGSGKFPSFADLLRILPEIVRQSDFSGEVKGNYIGSLVTRVKSLTDGLYGCVFAQDEIEPRILFDEDVLIDLSRVGSGETKALIMGIMVMKLQEYRMCHAAMNAPLSHVTVLEEAHHLLRAAPSGSPEGVDLRAMSLGMITNAIAEMRTYGEGFLIADQSPGLMDLAAIRNTNTKVIFKLPERSDRRIAGSAMSLSEAQIDEIARLERGVAVVYQSGWDNAVLAKIRHYDSGHYRPYVYSAPDVSLDSGQIRVQCLAALLRSRLDEIGSSTLDVALCRQLLEKRGYADGTSRERLAVLENLLSGAVPRFPELCRRIDGIVDTRELMRTCGSAEHLELWEARAYVYLDPSAQLSENERRELLLLCLNIRAGDSAENRKLYFRCFSHSPKKPF